MKKLTTLLVLFFTVMFGFSQTVVFQEGFETLPLSVTSSGNPGWSRSNKFAKTGVYSDSSRVVQSDSSYLTTATFSTAGNSYVVLEFAHICKIDFFDKAEIEVSIDNGATWTKLTGTEYLGTGQFGNIGNKFTATSYPIWDPTNENSIPQNAWWKNETFDISAFAANQQNVIIRFKLCDGGTLGGGANYGWLLDDIKVTAAPSELIPPVVTLQIPIIQDTILTTAPYEIIALITDVSGIDTAYITYSVNGGGSQNIGMVHQGSNIYSGFIPSQSYNTHVDYQVFAVDASPAANIGQSPSKWFYVKKGPDIVTLGTGASFTDTYTHPVPYGTYYKNHRVQYLVYASELSALGITAGNLVSIAFNVETLNTLVPMPNYTIKMKNTTATELTNSFDNGAYTTVWTDPSFMPVVGWNTHSFTTPFNWDGTSNVLIDLCFDIISGSYTQNASCYYTPTTTNTASYYRSDSYAACNTTEAAIPGVNRADMQIGIEPNNSDYDAGIYQIVNPSGTVLSGVQIPVDVRVKNYGLLNLTTCQIGWSVNGVAQTPVPWTGNLSQDQISNPFNIGNYTFASGPYVIKAWTFNPNGQTDEKFINDTSTVNVYCCDAILNGNYTVGGVGADYPTIANALQALELCGVDGPVTMNINPGTYSERMYIPVIPGISATNTVTFKGAGNQTIINYLPPSSTERFVVYMNNKKFLRFDSLTIDIPDTATYGWGFFMTNQCEDIVIKNCSIKTLANSTLTNFAGIVASGSATSATAAGNTVKNLIVENNTVNGGYYGVVLVGEANNKTRNIILEKNNIFNVYNYGLYMSQSVAPLINKNTLEARTTGTFTTSSYGIYLGTIDSTMRITKNKVKNVGLYGIYLTSCNSTAAPIVLANNFIGGGFVNTGSAYGLYMGASSNLNVYYNSINMNSGTGSAIYALSTVAQLSVLNNSFAYTGTANGYASYIASTASLTTHNYNNYFSNTSNKFVYYGIDMADLAALQAVDIPAGNDTSSKVGNPNYATPLSLYPTGTQLWNSGTPITTITDDIDGLPRSATSPCIGAVEYAPPADDAALLAVVQPLNSACALTANEDVILRIKNFGTATITSIQATYVMNNNTPVTETFAVNIPMDTIREITFLTKANMATAGIYNFNFWVNKTADINQLNDSILNYKVYHSHDFYSGAYTMSFEATEYYADWSVVNNGGGATTWVYPYNNATLANTGTNSAVFQNGTTNSGQDWLFSRCFDLVAGNTYDISFYYRNGSTTVGNNIELKMGTQKDSAQMLVSLINLPGILNTTYQKASTTFVPATSGTYYFGWNAYSSPSTTYAYIDDINLKILPPVEASVISMPAPVSACGMGMDTIIMLIKNTGSDTLNTTLTTNYQVDGGTIVSETVTLNDLAPNQTVTHTFATLFDFTSIGINHIFDVNAWIELTGDPMQFNDTITKPVVSSYAPVNPVTVNDVVVYGGQANLNAISTDSIFWYNSLVGGNSLASGHTFITPPLFNTTVYYAQAITPGGTTTWNFDNDLQGWNVLNPCNSSSNWAWHADNGDGALFAVNPLVTGAQLVVSPQTLISGSSSLDVSFTHHYATETGWDEGYVAYKLDNGPWTQFIPTVNGYNVTSQNIDSDPLNNCVSNNKPCYSGTQNTPIVTSGTIITGGADNIQLAFVFTSDGSGAVTGWFINEVTIGGGPGGCLSDRIPDTAFVTVPDYEAEIIDIVSPVEGNCSYGSEQISITIKNNGVQNIINGLTAYYQINNGTVVTENVSTPVPSNDSIVFTFTTPLNIVITGQDSTINVKAYVNHAGDPYLLNDTLAQDITLLYTPAPPTATSPVSTPYGTSTTITATSAQPIKWFDMEFGGTEIGTGANYITPVLYDTTTFWAEANNTVLGVQTTVGTGTSATSNLPTYGLFDYSWAASIYKASDLAFQGIIDTITYNVSNAITPYTMPDQRIYMMLTTDSVFANADKPDPATMTEVFIDDITWVGPGWFKIPLQTPFNYNGTSNLIIYWENWDGSWASGYPSFLYSNADNNSNKYNYDDGSLPTYAGTLTNVRPNVRFSHSQLGCPSLRTPVQVDISNYPANDAGIISIDAPNSPTNLGSQNIEVTLKNYGASNLTTVDINWEVDGIAQPTHTWNGNLTNGQTISNVDIGAYNFTLGLHDFKVWTTNPNGSADIYNLNDTAYTTIDSYEPLNGIYTIGGTNPDFPTFTAARNALMHYGVSGPVTFMARDGIYTEKLSLTAFTGASATNTVTFMPDTNATVTLTAADTFVVKILNASYYIFDGVNHNFNIINTSTGANTAAFWLAGGNTDITLMYCRISAGSNAVINFAVHASGASISTVSTGNNNNLIIDNNIINKAYYGVYVKAPTASLNQNLMITNNFIGSSNLIEYILYRGIDIQGANAPLIESNEIINMQVSSALNVSGVEIGQDVMDAKICKNKIRGLRSTSTSGYGAYGININSATNVSNIEISNNFISDIVTANYSNTSTLWNPFGIRITGGTGHKIWHNSINLFGAPANGTNASMSACLIVTSATVTGLDVRNNVFANSMTGLTSGTNNSKAYTIHTPSVAVFNKLDYNDYYTNTPIGYIGFGGTTDITTLTAWKLLTLKDTNSINVNPGFLTVNDLHTFSTSINSKATPLTAVTDDIDGDARHATTPDMGADEFDPLDWDLGIVEVISPANNCGLSSTSLIIVKVKNNGQNPITNFTISYTVNNATPVSQTFTGTLATDSLHTFTFTTTADLSAIMAYSIFFEAVLTGDQYALNDTLTHYIPAIHDFANPYMMGFETTENHQAWSHLNVLNDANYWLFPYNNTTYSHTGTNSAELLNSSTAPSNDWLFSPCFLLEANKTYKVEFYYRAQNVSYPQNIKLMFGQDKTPAAMTDTLVVLNGFTNLVHQKASGTVNISTTGTYYFGWHGYSPASYYYAYVDDINIKLLAPKDAGVTELVNITPVMNGGDAINLQAKIKNFGADTLFSIPVKYSINGGTPVTETWMGTLLPDSSVIHNFATSMTIPTNQFDICAWTQLTQDGNHGNDTLCSSVFGIPLVTIPFEDNLEGSAFFYIEGLNNQWQYGAPTANVINTAHSPSNVWATNLAGNYNNSSNYNLYSPRFDFTGIVNAEIGFWHWYDTETAFDGGRLQYTNNNGSTWQTLGSVGDPLGTNWYTHAGINNAPAFSGQSAGWVYSTYNLAQFNNYPLPVQFRFDFYSNVSNVANGWAVDDIEIFQNQIAQDGGVIAILSPTPQVVTGSSQTVQVTIKNFGTDPLTSIPVRYRVDNGVPVSEQWTGNLAPGATTDYTFTAPLVQTASFNLCAYTKVINDSYSQNDTTCMAVEIIPAQYDAGVTEITQPGTQSQIGTPVTVIVKIKNFGSEPISNVPLQYDVNSGTPVAGTYTGTLNPNDEVNYTFTQTYTSPGGNYILCAKTTLSNDQNATNDKICKTVTGTTGINDGFYDFTLGQNLPNPAHGLTVIPFSLPNNGTLHFEIVNIIGQVVYTLEKETAQGPHTIEIDADKLTDGLYFYTLTFNEQRRTRKLVITK